jgi:4-methyl-5(b-hydroxyethyl)-thiazole monophosphate biosynthesis
MVYLFLANGFEEIEALTPVDALRRAKVEIKTLSIEEDLTVTGAHGISVIADAPLSEYKKEDAEMLILPGGAEGTRRLGENEALREIILSAAEDGVYIAAICAAPTILAKLSLLTSLRATCYPSLASELIDRKVKYKSDRVVCDKRFITSAGAGTAGEFAFTLIEKLKTKDEADRVKYSMIYK